MKKVEKKIALKGQAYVAPRAKSFMITNQGVLCGSGGGGTTLNLTPMSNGSL